MEEAHTTSVPEPASGLYPSEFAAWARAAHGDAGPPQAPADELLAEHHVMTAVFAALEHETGAMKLGQPLRPRFWVSAIDFIDNFVHHCHRRKEERLFFPALVEHGSMPGEDAATVEREHHTGMELTLRLDEAVDEGDWERVMRLISVYLGFIRPHMRREERLLAQPDARTLHHRAPDLPGAFAEAEERALAHRGRLGYLELARRLCEVAGVPCPLGDPA